MELSFWLIFCCCCCYHFYYCCSWNFSLLACVPIMCVFCYSILTMRARMAVSVWVRHFMNSTQMPLFQSNFLVQLRWFKSKCLHLSWEHVRKWYSCQWSILEYRKWEKTVRAQAKQNFRKKSLWTMNQLHVVHIVITRNTYCYCCAR